MKRFSQLAAVLVLAMVAFAQSDEIGPNENLVAEGIPKIPASLAESVGRYSEFRTAGFASWHPAKREMLIETRFGDTSQVHQVKFPGGARTQLTFFPDRIAGASYQPGKGDSFLFVKDVGGGEFFQLYRYDLATGAITLLTDGKSRNTSPAGRIRETASPTAPQSGRATMWTYGSSTRPTRPVHAWSHKWKAEVGKFLTGRPMTSSCC
jgi:hypothetical protein